ncbi:WD repeat-containing protein 20 isoform X2 [Exaiptasia diaphana]|uniref:WD repeat-containing protein 20 n=1 Tax=Exaiptasia diaphana TaxID=2652724 RepID=A0A913WVT4_EXADI|nr:WD repeat-containing protein 20 isoform X2 [Exaiptasia diaphana]KXJ17504.1 WD repeat-containing protein 20 [Exaiptasia diaphana]
MASHKGPSSELKQQFVTKEGVYRLMTLSEYSRPNKMPYSVQQCHPVRVSFVTVKEPGGCNDRIAFNVGRDLYFYIYKGVRKAADLTKPLDKRVYKGTIPTCHDFNLLTRCSESLELLIGFSAGQVQLLDPIRHEVNKLFNEDRTVDKTKVTCLKWIPGSESLFLVSHESSNMYVYNKENPPGTGPPQYALMKQGPGYIVASGKSKTTRNPVCKWTVGENGINEFCFSPDCKHLAVVTQDGCLRVFDFDAQTLYGVMKSYFGGLTCTCWSPDGKYIVTGGEDDLVTVWSFHERRVIARGQGHQSWISVVSFDPYTTSFSEDGHVDESDEEDIEENGPQPCHSSPNAGVTSYRFGSVGHDTMLLLWDLGGDVLRPQRARGRSVRAHTTSNSHLLNSNSICNGPVNSWESSSSEHTKSLTKVHSLSKSVEQLVTVKNYSPGTALCPRMEDAPMLEPLVAKKIAYERLTDIIFREDCIVTACQEGFIRTWARPGKVGVVTMGTVV